MDTVLHHRPWTRGPGPERPALHGRPPAARAAARGARAAARRGPLADGGPGARRARVRADRHAPLRAAHRAPVGCPGTRPSRGAGRSAGPCSRARSRRSVTAGTRSRRRRTRPSGPSVRSATTNAPPGFKASSTFFAAVLTALSNGWSGNVSNSVLRSIRSPSKRALRVWARSSRVASTSSSLIPCRRDIENASRVSANGSSSAECTAHIVTGHWSDRLLWDPRCSA